MVDVLRKMREDAEQAAASEEQAPQAAGSAVQEQGAAPALPAPAPAAGAASPASGFVPSDAPQRSPPVADPAADETPPAPAPAAPPISTETVEWNAKRVDAAVVAFHDRCSSICEQYRSIRARLLTMNAGGAHQVIALTSSVPQEGKSVSTVNLGMVMAEGGEHSILIADADFRRTSLARMLGIPARPGLAELIRGDAEFDEVLQPTPHPNLKIIPAGASVDKNYAELLGGPLARAVLNRFRSAFDYTFLDTPPVTTVADVCMLAPHCDGTIVVVEMRRTPEPTVQQAVRTLQTNNVKVLGCILSRYQDHSPRYYDRYYYRYYRSD